MEPDILFQSDLHCLAEMATEETGWDAEIVEKDPGLFNSDVLFFQSGPLQVVASYTNKALILTGGNPVGFYNYLVQMTDGPACKAYGSSLSCREIMVGREELDIVAPAEIRGVDLSFEQSFFEEKLAPLCGYADRNVSFRPSAEALTSLKMLLHRAVKELRHRPDRNLFPLIQKDITEAFGDCLLSAAPGNRRTSPKGRHQIVRRAIDFIRSCDHFDVRLSDLAKAAAASERTLQYAFKDQLGIAPKVFLKHYRLQRLHRELRARTNGTVVNAARKWGFWHMGQLGVDYKRLFGEPPSRTLRKMPRNVQVLVSPSALAC